MKITALDVIQILLVFILVKVTGDYFAYGILSFAPIPSHKTLGELINEV